jgi:hypothetical protein
MVRLSVSPLVLRAADGGYRGRTVATIPTTTAGPPAGCWCTCDTQNGLRLDVPAEPDRPDPAPAWWFPVGPVPAGAAHTARLDFRVPAPAASFPTTTTFTVTVTARRARRDRRPGLRGRDRPRPREIRGAAHTGRGPSRTDR